MRGMEAAIKAEFSEGGLGVGVNSFYMTLVPPCKMVEASTTGLTKNIIVQHKYRTSKI